MCRSSRSTFFTMVILSSLSRTIVTVRTFLEKHERLISAVHKRGEKSVDEKKSLSFNVFLFVAALELDVLARSLACVTFYRKRKLQATWTSGPCCGSSGRTECTPYRHWFELNLIFFFCFLFLLRFAFHISVYSHFVSLLVY